MERGLLRVALHTFGCRLNQFETDAIGRHFEVEGHQLVDSPECAELLIVNTCTVTEAADREARRFVVRWVRRLGPRRVVVTGCAAQRRPELFAGIHGVRLVAGNEEKRELPRLLQESAAESGTPVRRRAPGRRPPQARLAELRVEGRSHLARAYLRVQDGCSQRCTFCTLPSVRGSSGSLPLEEVLREARALERAGHREIVLTGAHLGSYGYDLRPRIRLGALTGAVLKAVPQARLRLSSLEPRFVDAELLRLLAEEPRLCPHLHLPLQSADDAILARMRRAYRWEAYEASVRRAVAAVRHRADDGGLELGLGADFLVGFPGETDASFARTLERIAQLPFTYGHVFPYSERQGTPAAQLDGQVPDAVRRRRAAVVRGLLAGKARSFHETLRGRTVEIVVERVTAGPRPGRYRVRGTSERFVSVEAEGDGPPPPARRRLRVSIREADAQGCRGFVESPSTVTPLGGRA